MPTLSSGPAVAVVDRARGGRLASLVVDGHELLVQPEPGEAPDPLMWGCFPMVPFAGRVRGGRFVWGGRLVEMPQNHAGHAMHGTLFDDRWLAERTEDRYVRLRARLEPRWPFPGWAIQEVSLSPTQIELRLEVHTAEAPFPATAGWHPWFRRRLDDGDLDPDDGSADLQVGLHASRWYPRDLDGLPTGAVLPVPQHASWDDCFTAVTWPVTLTWPGLLSATLTSTCSHVVLYDQHRQGICVEPQSGPPDAFNLDRAHVVRPDDPLVLEATLSWAT